MNDGKKKPRMAKGRNITKGQLWRAREKQQKAQSYNALKGKRGILVITNRGREVNGGNEVISWLETIAEEEESSSSDDDEKDEDDIQHMVEKELDLARKKKRTRYDVGLECLGMVRCHADPLILVRDLFNSVLESGVAKTTHVEKLIPFQTICATTMEQILLNGKHVLDAFFETYRTSGFTSFAIALRIRGGEGAIKRQDILAKFADLVQEGRTLKVDLETPDIMVGVELIRGVTGIFVLPASEYVKFKKFNLRGLLTTDSAE